MQEGEAPFSRALRQQTILVVIAALRRWAFPTTFGIALAIASVWLLLGLLPALASASPTFHRWLHDGAGSSGVIGQVAGNAARAAHAVVGGGHITLDYVFSAFNIALACLVVWLRPHERTAQLLSIGLIGTAIAFNLQGHDALQVLPVGLLGPVNFAHVWIHIASGVCYVFALLTFPTGRFVEASRIFTILRPGIIAVITLFFVALSSITVDDHTAGLVMLFGIFIPIAGIVSQAGRYRHATNEEEREQSRVLLGSLVLSLLVAGPLIYLSNALGGSTSRTVSYEVEAPAPGTYFFRCDPHPEEMVGTVEVVPGGPSRVTLSAENSEFDRSSFTLAAGKLTAIDFTNFDSDLHNVSIYRDPKMSDPLLLGKEFSGSTTGVTAFRIFRAVMLVLPVALLVGLVKFRLWDLNRIVRKTLAYGLLVAFITAAYVGTVVGLTTLFGTARLSLWLSILVTVGVAAAFQPLRDWARRFADLVVFGRRATPYELLSEFANRVGSAPDLERLIPELARSLGEGTRSAASEVWLRVDSRLMRVAAWPDEDGTVASVPLIDGDIPALGGRDRVIPVRQADELLGALTITKPPGEEITPIEDRLLEDAASQTGLALKNVQLTTELQARLEELRASRQRIVAAQDAERRRLERDIHDGAQQHLVALAMKLRMAQDVVDKDPAQARDLMSELQEDTGDALQALRDLARGIHPPVLSDRGLAAALEAHARRMSVPVSINAGAIGRYPAEIETAVYFCCTESIQNAIKHADASRIDVSLRADDGQLVFSVSDDGVGFEAGPEESGGLSNIRDRVAAVAGSVEIRSAPGRGTTVEGRIPVPRST